MAKNVQGVEQYYRYCPGEERIRISDAICLARRRANFPKCKGCPFNDDETGRSEMDGLPGRGETRGNADQVRRDEIESLFRDCDVRGPYPEPLNADAAWRIGLAVAQFLRSELRGYDRSQPEKSAVVVGRDMRRSSGQLADALKEGLRSGGSPVIDIGMIDTPQLYFAVNRLTCCGGVQVTGSELPAGYSGLRICAQKSRPISTETGLAKICKIAQNTIRHTGVHKADQQKDDLTEPYKEFVRRFLNTSVRGYGGDRPLRLVIDASNGMAGRWVPILFDDVEWLEIIRLNFEHNGDFVHDPDPLAEANLAQLRDRVIRSKADMGACFDGDAARCVLVDNRGDRVPPDAATALLARHLLRSSPGSTVVHDLRCSRRLAEEIRKSGGVPRRERCGYAQLKKALADAKGVLAGDIDGYSYFKDNWCCESGFLLLVHILNLVTSSGQSLGELVASLKQYVGVSQRAFQCSERHVVLPRLAEKYGDGAIDYLDGITIEYKNWWCNVRSSETEPIVWLNLEARDESILQARLAELTSLLGKPLNG